MDDFAEKIEVEAPRLRRYARALTRNDDTADDLVQDCLLRGFAKRHLWQDGTDLRAWLFTILHNQFVNNVRRGVRQGSAIEIRETEPAFIRAANQEKHLELRDLDLALAQLPEEQRIPILLIGLEGMSYEATAEVTDVPVGTVRSRLSRGREALRQLMGIRDDPKAEETMRDARSRDQDRKLKSAA